MTTPRYEWHSRTIILGVLQVNTCAQADRITQWVCMDSYSRMIYLDVVCPRGKGERLDRCREKNESLTRDTIEI